MQHVDEVVGMLGVGMILFAYYQLTVGRIRADNLLYQLLNLVGSLMILYSLFFKWNTPSVVIEVFWIYISMLGLWRSFKKFQGGRSP